MSVLMALADEQGRVVTRERLLERVWGDKFVTEEVLTRAISLLRRVLGDNRLQPRYIETIRQGGYRLVAGVESLGAAAGEAEVAAPSTSSELAEADHPPTMVTRKRPYWLAVVGATAAALVLALLFTRGPAITGGGADAPRSAAKREYLEGRYFLGRRNLSGYQKAVERFHAALDRDPLNATAHAALAESYFLLGFYRAGVQPVPVAMERARAAARRALELQPRLAQAHAVLGAVAWAFDYDLESGERHLHRSLELHPGHATARQWLSWLLLVAGRPDAAEAELARAAELDPLSAIIATARGTQAFTNGDLDTAERRLLSALEMDPGFARAHFSLGLTYEARGKLDLAIQHFTRAATLMEQSIEARAALAHCHASRGDRSRAEATLAELVAAAPTSGYSAAFEIALLHEALGRRAVALEWLDEGLARRSILSYSLLLEPRMRDLRQDARFEVMLRSRVPQLRRGDLPVRTSFRLAS